MKSTICKSVLFIYLLSFGIIAKAQTAGTLDTTFGSGGIAEPQIFSSFEGMAIQSDNKIVVIAGTTIARLNANGTLETSLTSLPCNPTALRIQPDGKIVWVGNVTVQTTVHFCIGRLNTNFSPDGSFDNDGVATTPTGIESQFSSVNILPDGKILAAGWTSLQTTLNRDYAMVKYNANGSLDTSFGTSGRIATELGSNEFSYDSVVQADGKIVLVGDFTETLTNQKMAGIVRYNADGTIDNSFGNNGRAFKTTGTFGKADDVEIQPDGKIIIAGYALIPARYNPNGTLDTEFNPPSWATSGSVAIQPNGKILIAGSSAPENIILARYNKNGTLDTGFGVGGIVNTTGGMNSNLVFSTKILLAPDKKIVLGGTHMGGGFQMVIARYLNNAGPFMDFDGDNRTDVSIFRPSNGQWWFLRSSDSSNYALQFGVSTDKIVPADYTGDGLTDVAVYRPSTGEWFILRSEDYTYYAFPFGISTDTPTPADFDGDGRVDPAVFRPSTGTWYIQRSGGGLQITNFGLNADKPVPADYDGDGETDIAVYRAPFQWWILQSSTGSPILRQFGVDGPLVPADYTGDGKADLAVFHIGEQKWYIERSENQSVYTADFGLSGDYLVPGDYDGDGKYDQAFFRPSTNTWHIRRSIGGFDQHVFGTTGDKPTPTAFLP